MSFTSFLVLVILGAAVLLGVIFGIFESVDERKKYKTIKKRLLQPIVNIFINIGKMLLLPFVFVVFPINVVYWIITGRSFL
jgi:Na+/H+-dicarboxylate symporter